MNNGTGTLGGAGSGAGVSARTSGGALVAGAIALVAEATALVGRPPDPLAAGMLGAAGAGATPGAVVVVATCGAAGIGAITGWLADAAADATAGAGANPGAVVVVGLAAGAPYGAVRVAGGPFFAGAVFAGVVFAAVFAGVVFAAHFAGVVLAEVFAGVSVVGSIACAPLGSRTSVGSLVSARADAPCTDTATGAVGISVTGARGAPGTGVGSRFAGAVALVGVAGLVLAIVAGRAVVAGFALALVADGLAVGGFGVASLLTGVGVGSGRRSAVGFDAVAGAIAPDFDAGAIAPDFDAGAIVPDFDALAGAIAPDFDAGAIAPDFDVGPGAGFAAAGLAVGWRTTVFALVVPADVPARVVVRGAAAGDASADCLTSSASFWSDAIGVCWSCSHSATSIASSSTTDASSSGGFFVTSSPR